MGTNINEGISQAALYLHQHSNPQSRRVILAITDDVPTQRSISPSEGTTYKRLHESGSVVCGLIFFNPMRYSRVNLAVGNVRAYAHETGGIVIYAEKDRLGADLDELIERLRSRYSFGYVSSNETRQGKFRKIRIELSPQAQGREGKAEIIARKGYSTEEKNK